MVPAVGVAGVGLIVISIVAIVAQPPDGVNVYVVVPAVERADGTRAEQGDAEHPFDRGQPRPSASDDWRWRSGSLGPSTR